MNSKIPYSTRIIAKILTPSLGSIRAMERALRLEGVIRFSVLTLTLIVSTFSIPCSVRTFFSAKCQGKGRV